MKAETRKLLWRIGRILEQAKRSGTQLDEPEGSRYVTITDRLAQTMMTEIQQALEAEDEPAPVLAPRDPVKIGDWSSLLIEGP